MTVTIGIIGSANDGHYQVKSDYIDALERNGASVVYLVGGVQCAWWNFCDGFLMTGGGDVDPFYFGQHPAPGLGDVNATRDERELKFLQLLKDHPKPLLGICRGMQVMNVAAGGSVIQHMDEQTSPSLLQHSPHRQRHEYHHSVKLYTTSKLFSWIKHEEIRVNSFHHQAIDRLGNGFETTATSPDNIIEAIEHPEYHWYGVQWHPETMPNCSWANGLFSGFIETVKEYKYANY